MDATVGIREYWLVDLTRTVVLVHTDPSGAGYLSIESKQRDDTWIAHLLPTLAVSGEEIFGTE
jgi:Uma2 family endonuclease